MEFLKGLPPQTIRVLFTDGKSRLKTEILELVKEQNHGVQEIAASVIEMLHQLPKDDQVMWVLSLRHDETLIIRKLGVIALSAFKQARTPRIRELDQRVIDGLIDALDDPTLDVIGLALIGISTIKSRKARRAVARVMRLHPDEAIRATAAWALKIMKQNG